MPDEHRADLMNAISNLNKAVIKDTVSLSAALLTNCTAVMNSVG